MAYSKTVWNNNTPPDISAENLNKMEQGIYDAQFPDNGSTGQILSKTNDGTGWVDAPTSAEWGNITGQLSEQTDLYSELESKITMPSGGTTGQVLTKTATGQAWDDVDGLPSGGTAGQVLTKNSSTDGDASWQTSPSGGGGTWGYISGTLTDQTDLVAALDAKANASNLATIESSTTASQAYSEGDYLVLNGQLYEVTTAISSGETLTVGTNISATTVGSELTALNNGLTSVQNELRVKSLTLQSANSSVTITAQSAKLFGNVLAVFVTFTLSSQVSIYGNLISLGGKSASAGWILPVYTAGMVPVNDQSVYGDAGNTNIRSSRNLPAGTYRIGGIILVN